MKQLHISTHLGLSAAMLAFWVQSGIAQPAPPAQPIRIKSETSTTTIAADGLASAEQHIEVQVLTTAGVMGLSQFPITYSPQLTDVEIKAAYTLKPDGQKLPVDTSAIMARAAPGNPYANNYTDFIQKVVIFPNVQIGDVLVLDRIDRTKQAYIPGQFMGTRLISSILGIDSGQYVLKAPAGSAMQLEARGLTVVKSREGTNTVYTVNYAVPTPRTDTNPQISPWDRMPVIYASTLHSYDEMSHAFASIIADKMIVTPKLQALADQLTAGVTDRREQTKRIYNYISMHIRYVRIALGTGGWVPHDAETVLNNGYGDCKDKAMLFSTLLKAKGIDSQPVLINSGNSYTLSGPPTFSQLDHVITWLPEFKIYADATAQVSPFGTLPLEEYGKPVIHVVASGPTRRTIPNVAPGVLTMQERTQETLGEDGKLSGTTQLHATGGFEARLRGYGIGLQVTTTPPLPYSNLHPTFKVEAPEDLDKPFQIEGRFAGEANSRLLNEAGFTPPPGTWLVTRPGGLLAGQITQLNMTENDDTPCYSGHEDEEVMLTFPANRHLALLPPDTDIKDVHLHYVAHWSTKGNIVTVHRSFDTNYSEALCHGETRKEAMNALARIRQEYTTQVAVTK